MIIAIVDFEVAADQRPEVLALLARKGAAAVRQPGNLGFRLFCNANSDGHVGVMHEWSTADAFERYLRSDEFAALGAALKPNMTGPPISTRYDATVYAG